VAGAGTSVAQANGTTSLAYTDPDDGSIALDQAKGTGSLARISTPGTANGLFPALAVTNHNHVQLAWYNSVDQDLLLGLYPEQLGAIALPPSPIPYTPPGGGSSGTCPKSTVEITAPIGAAGSGYTTTSVQATSGDFTVCFNNEDTIAHNVAIFKDKATADSGGAPLASDPLFSGPKINTFQVKGLAPGQYYFHCDAHPPTMFGTLTVK
jgi:plastocyanin